MKRLKVKKILFLIIGLLIYNVGNAQNEEINLNLPPLYDSMGHRLCEAIDYMYEKASGHVMNVGNAKIDSVVAGAAREFCDELPSEEERNYVLRFDLGIKTIVDSVMDDTRSNGYKVLREELMSAINTKYPKGEEFRFKENLGDINLKARETLSPGEADWIYQGTSSAYYFNVYWRKHGFKWFILVMSVKSTPDLN